MIGVAINAVDPRQVLEREREDVSQSRERFVGERSTAAFGGEALHSATYCPGGSPRWLLRIHRRYPRRLWRYVQSKFTH